MEQNNSQEQLLKTITSLLQKANIPYMITGSISVVFYGRPRASHDIDFVVEAHAGDIKRILRAFTSLPQNEFLVDPLTIDEEYLALWSKKQNTTKLLKELATVDLTMYY